MALFHLSVTQTKRSAGQSAIASAAYRAGERLYSEYYGEYSDYTKKGGFQAFMLFPFHPAHTKLGEEYHLQRVGAWEDMKMMALSRLILDNIDHVKAFWIMLTMPVAQLALGFGADDRGSSSRSP